MQKSFVPSVGKNQSANREGMTEEGKGILCYVLEMRYLSFEQVQRKFSFKGVEEAVRELIKADYLKCKDEVLVFESLLRATSKAQELLQRLYPDKKIPQAEKNIFMPRVKHDLLLNDLRIRFEELGFIKKWVSEGQLKELPVFLRAFTELPDAVCVKKNEKSYFLELEVSQKASKQYRERIAEYLKVLEKEEIRKAHIEGVIFFCYYEEVRDKIKSEIPEGARGISVLLYKNYFKEKKPKVQGVGAKSSKETSEVLNV